MEIENIFQELIRYCSRQKYPDIHLSSGSYPLIRNRNGDIETLSEITAENGETVELSPLPASEIEHIARYILSPDKYLDYVDHLEVDSSYSLE